MKITPTLLSLTRLFYRDQSGRSPVVFTLFIGLMGFVFLGSLTFAMTDGDPMATYQRISVRMYWTAKCKENIPGACQMAKIQW